MITNFLLLIFIPQIVIASPDGSFLAEIEYFPGTELIARTLTLRHDNVVRYVKESPLGATFFLNDRGNAFGISAEALYFYDQDGNETRLQSLNAPNGFKMTPDRTIFLASDLDGLFAYDQAGLLKHEFPACRLFASNNTASLVAAVTAESLFVYERGERIHSAGLVEPYVWSISLDEDKRLIKIQFSSSVEEHRFTGAAGGR